MTQLIWTWAGQTQFKAARPTFLFRDYERDKRQGCQTTCAHFYVCFHCTKNSFLIFNVPHEQEFSGIFPNVSEIYRLAMLFHIQCHSIPALFDPRAL